MIPVNHPYAEVLNEHRSFRTFFSAGFAPESASDPVETMGRVCPALQSTVRHLKHDNIILDQNHLCLTNQHHKLESFWGIPDG